MRSTTINRRMTLFTGLRASLVGSRPVPPPAPADCPTGVVPNPLRTNHLVVGIPASDRWPEVSPVYKAV
jgi:hypothetical protein